MIDGVGAGTLGAAQQRELGVVGVAAIVMERYRPGDPGRFDDNDPAGPLTAKIEGGAVDDAAVRRNVGPAPRLHHEWNAPSRRGSLGRKSHCAPGRGAAPRYSGRSFPTVFRCCLACCPATSVSCFPPARLRSAFVASHRLDGARRDHGCRIAHFDARAEGHFWPEASPSVPRGRTCGAREGAGGRRGARRS